MATIIYDGVIKHHGIKGQRWGDLNGPPYPLDAQDHSSAERKEGTSGWTKEAKKEEKSTEKKKSFNPETAKKIAIGVGVVAGAAALTYVAVKASNNYSNSDIQDLVKEHSNDVNELNKELGLFNEESKQLNESISEAKEKISNLKTENEEINSDIESIKNEIKGLTDEVQNEDTENQSLVMKKVLNDISKREDYEEFNNIDDIKNLSDNEIRSLTAYTTAKYYKDINAAAQDIYENYDDQFKDPSSKFMAKEIKSAMEKCKLVKDTKVERGLDENGFRKIFGSDGMEQLNKIKASIEVDKFRNSKTFNIDSIKDQKISSKGFSSTGIPVTLGEGRSHSSANYFAGTHGVAFDIVAPKGSKGICIAPFSELNGENEILFDVGSNLVLTGEARINEGVLHLGAVMKQE